MKLIFSPAIAHIKGWFLDYNFVKLLLREYMQRQQKWEKCFLPRLPQPTTFYLTIINILNGSYCTFHSQFCIINVEGKERILLSSFDLICIVVKINVLTLQYYTYSTWVQLLRLNYLKKSVRTSHSLANIPER